ncbi:MAG: translation initiation factor IF-2 [Clostridia bacterium]|nr:translation initiation factor IF-2 [Clostridia bacterium]
MGKIKIYDIAKKLGLTSKEVLDIAKKINIEAKSHLSGVEEDEAKKIESELSNKSKKGNIDKVKSEEKKANADKNKKEVKKEETTPVIIRREVIISKDDEQDKKKEEHIKQQKRNNNVGFVERKQDKNYNIVYRNKPTKPMTVSELFGLKKEEPKEEKVVVKEKKASKIDNVEEVRTNPREDRQPKFDNRNNRENRTDRRNFDNRNERNNYNNRSNNKFNNNRFNGNNNNNRFNNNRNSNDRYNNKNGVNDRFNNRRPLDEKGIEKNIKNIMAVDTVEKESVREYNKSIDKQKNNNKFDENRAKKNKTRRNNGGNDFDEGKLKSLKQANRLSNMFDDQDGGMLDYYDLSADRGRRKKKKNQEEKQPSKQKIFQLTEIEIPESITIKDFAAEMKKTTADVITKLLGYGIMATINQEIDYDTAFLIAQEFGITANKKEIVTDEDILFDDSEDKEEDLQPRPPVIVVMGHVDHGKTSLLDAVRKTNVIEGEAGGITQAIGAYKVKVNGREITFLDTPGHEAFTAMRARGAQITDIAILVVAANDGVKPQTIEAINHAKSAGIPIIVAINKIDLPDANIEKVKQELMAYDLVPEEWGGETIYVPISAKKGENIDQLLEMVLLEADVLELKANPNKQAKGAVIEARLDKSKGAIATMLVQRGTLDVGDTIVVGSSIGRIRAMKDEKGKTVKKAGPSTPVEIMGLTEVPEAGDIFYEVKNEKVAKHLIEKRKRQAREKAINSSTKVTLDNIFSQMEEGKLKVLNLIVKADVQGSVEAVKQSLEKLHNEEVKVKVIHAAAGAVNQSDVTLAKVSNAIIIAFNVRPDNLAKEMAEKDEVEIKQYSIIYQAIEDVEAAMKGMLEPKYEEKVIGNAEVRQTFKISNVGTIAGCYVLSGKVERNAGVRVIRENVVIHDGHLVTLKRFKDEVKEVGKGFECGIQIENYNDIKEGDMIEVYIMEEIKR